ncbi:hypothetical protein ABZ642_42145 [Streptomyces sp. NPDC007157]|uniref:hypothetical protein n=1 Tax=Streptomyces sp. NPDC007157 TaxID=3154681 RepID=UPI0033CABE96
MGIGDTSIAALSAAFSGLAAFGAWKASCEANETAASVARIERDRWHDALTPQLRLKLERSDGLLYVRFDGLAQLGRLSVRLTVRDDFDRSRVRSLAGGPTPEAIAGIVWGPYRFRPGIDGADQLGRSVAPFPLEAGDRTRLALDPSVKPAWYEGADGEERWRRQYQDATIRLWADCEAEGHRPWRLSFGVTQDGRWAQTGRIVGS